MELRREAGEAVRYGGGYTEDPARLEKAWSLATASARP